MPTAVIDTGAPADADGPPVLLLHGSGPGVTALANWRPVIPALSAARRVIAPDQLGFGGTATGEPRRFGRAAWTEHALALLDTLGVPAVDIIGNSMGGAIALSMAAARPAAVRRIVLMGSMGVAMALPSGLNTVWGYTPGVPQMREVIGLFAHNRALITDDLIEMRYQASLQPAGPRLLGGDVPAAAPALGRRPGPVRGRAGGHRRPGAAGARRATTGWCRGGSPRPSWSTCCRTRGYTCCPAAATGR